MSAVADRDRPSPFVIEAESVRVRRGTTDICSDVRLRVRTGECQGIVGPNGSGKTSLLLALRGLLCAEGSLRLFGRCPRDLPRAEVARLIAVVPQRSEFSFPYSVEEMVLLGRSPHRRPWEAFRTCDREVVHSLLDRFGLLRLARARVDAISGGERRKVFLARALAQEAPILFLDEPTAGLDPAAQADLFSILAELRCEHSRTIVVVLHDLHLAATLCDRVAGLRDGRQLWDGPPTEVLTPATLEALFDVPWTEVRAQDGGSRLIPRFAPVHPGRTPRPATPDERS